MPSIMIHSRIEGNFFLMLLKNALKRPVINVTHIRYTYTLSDIAIAKRPWLSPAKLRLGTFILH